MKKCDLFHNFVGLLVITLAFGLILAGCDTGSGGGGGTPPPPSTATAKKLTVTYTVSQADQGAYIALYGLFPTSATADDVITDAGVYGNNKANAGSNVVAASNYYEDTTKVDNSATSFTVTLYDAKTTPAWTTAWTGSGTYTIWAILLDKKTSGTWRLYKGPNVTVTATQTTAITVNASGYTSPVLTKTTTQVPCNW